MADKVCVILASRDRDVLRWGLQYSWRSIESKFLEDVKVVAFGPSEKVITEDPDLQEIIKRIQALGKVVSACKACSDEEGVSSQLSELDIEVEYVGSVISKLIKDGYVPMVW